MKIISRLYKIDNISILGKFAILFAVIILAIIINTTRYNSIREKISDTQAKTIVLSQMSYFSQQVILYGEFVIREVDNAKIDLERTKNLYEKKLYLLKNGGELYSDYYNRKLKPIDEQAKLKFSQLEKLWFNIKENAESIINEETFVGGSEMATGFIDEAGNYVVEDASKPLTSEVKSSILMFERNSEKFLYLNNELLEYYQRKLIDLNTKLNLLLFGFVFFYIIIILAGLWVIKARIFKPLQKLLHFAKDVSSGNYEAKVNIKQLDEIGQTAIEFSNFVSHISNAIEYVKKISGGKLHEDFKLINESDSLGESLISMKNTLIEAEREAQNRSKEDDIRRWATEGVAKFGEILRLNNSNLDELTYHILINLIEYINVNIGGIFVVEEKAGNKYFRLSSSHAFDRRKFLKKEIDFTEGLVGRCNLEKKTLFLKELPKDYIEISSGLGYSKPVNILLTPLIYNTEVYGVIELASFSEIEPYKIEFVERVSESIASTISSVKINLRTSQLLKESKEQAERLAQQEEEMRQNLEEMQATQEEAATKTKEMESIFESINQSLGVYFLDLEGNYLSANSLFTSMIGISSKSIYEFTHKDIAGKDFTNDREYFLFWNSVVNGSKESRDIKYTHKSGTSILLHETYTPILDTYGEIEKINVIAYASDTAYKSNTQSETSPQPLLDTNYPQEEYNENDTNDDDIFSTPKSKNNSRSFEDELSDELSIENQLEQINELFGVDNTEKITTQNSYETTELNDEPEISEAFPVQEIEDIVFWKDYFNTGIPEIDDLHQKILTQLNNIFKEYIETQDFRQIKSSHSELLALIQRSFNIEEKYFTEYNYKEGEIHKLLHSDLLDRFDIFEKAINAEEDIVIESFYTNVADWFVMHFETEDSKYQGGFEMNIPFSQPLANDDFSEQSTDELQFVDWTNSFEVGIDFVDDQHKIIIDLINQLITCYTDNRAKKQQKSVIKGLIDYTEYHFGAEEKYLRSKKHALTDEHKELHSVFIKSLHTFHKDFNSNKVQLNKEIIQFIQNWWTNHIKNEDKKLV